MSSDTISDERSILFHAAVVSDLLDGQLEVRLAPTRLSPRSFEIATVLVSRGPLSPGEIAIITGVPPPSVSRLTAQLEAAALVTLLPHPTDRRSRLVELTADGRAAFEEAQVAFGGLFESVAVALGAALPAADFGVRRLEWALRVTSGTPIPAPLQGPEAASRALYYPGERLDLNEEAEVLDYIEWLRQRAARRKRRG